MDDLSQQLAAAFAAEHAEHVAAIRAALIQAEAGRAIDLREIFRRAHSLKGAARAVDRGEIEELAHALETLLADVGSGPIDPAIVLDARELVDAIEDAAAEPAAATDGEEPAASDLLRISARPVERLGESVRALQADLDMRASIASDLRGTRAEIEAIRQACLAPDAAPTEIAVRLARVLADSNAIAARRIAADRQVERTAARLAGEAGDVLLAPAATLADGQERLVRTLAAEEGKEAELIVRAEGVDADRRVLQALRDPLNHLLRNAIGHGVEPPAVRAKAGKPPRARITLELAAREGHLLLAVEDDGPGPDIDAIVAAARARGVLPADAARPSDEDALASVFAHGVSTRGGVDRLAGRGVGLSVVADAAHRLHGNARMQRGMAGGGRIEIEVPLTIARRSVLLVECAGRTFAIPSRAVARAIRFPAAAIETHRGAPMLPAGAGAGGSLLPIVPLAGLLGLADAEIGEDVQAVALRAAGRTMLLVVDTLLDVRLLAIGDVDEIAVDLPLLLGVAQIGEGRLAPVLSPELLAAQVALGRAGPIVRTAATPRARTILVVDDSITTRTLERGILEGNGYRVMIAVDGAEGLETLRRARAEIDLVIADVEMPRMDGFGLLSAIRNDPALADIPVVMMTSRNSPDDIQRGLDLGANAYVTKQEFEQGQLLATVGRLV